MWQRLTSPGQVKTAGRLSYKSKRKVQLQTSLVVSLLNPLSSHLCKAGAIVSMKAGVSCVYVTRRGYGQRRLCDHS